MLRTLQKFYGVAQTTKSTLTVPLFQYHSSQSFHKKLAIGEASAILEEKISKISQLVFF